MCYIYICIRKQEPARHEAVGLGGKCLFSSCSYIASVYKK